MSHSVLLSNIAKADIALIPQPIRLRFHNHLFVGLGNYATALSRPSHLPYPVKCQLFVVDIDDGETNWELTTLFNYSQDETSVEVFGVGQRHYPLDDYYFFFDQRND